MTDSGERLLRNVLIGCSVMGVAGIAVAFWGKYTPVYTVPYEQASEAFAAWCGISGAADDAAGARYLATFGNHYPLVDAGFALVFAALTLAMLATALRRTTPAGQHWLRTPCHRWTWLAIGIGIMAWSLVAGMESIGTDYERRYFAPCADSIGIPIIGLIGLTFVATLVLTIAGVLLLLMFGRVPVPLTQWDAGRSGRSWIVTILFGLPMLAVLALAVFQVPTSGNGLIPPLLMAFYLLASTRAAMLAPVPDKAGGASADADLAAPAGSQ